MHALRVAIDVIDADGATAPKWFFLTGADTYVHVDK
jgi:hypothetical protein